MKENDPQDPHLTAGRHISYWTETTLLAERIQLKENLQTDVVIVGGGLAGLSVAYCLVLSGKKVVLVEDGVLGSGETGRTTAHLVTALDDRYHRLIKVYGKEKAGLIAESHQAAIDFVEQTVKKENIDCGFERVNGYLFLHPSDKKDSLDRELKAAQKAGVEISRSEQVPGILLKKGGLCFGNQAQFQPLKYLEGLANAIIRKGGQIFTSTHASKIDHEGITTGQNFRVNAKHIVIATNNPINNFFAMSLKQYAYRTYVIGALVKKDLLPKALWWDTGDFKSDARIPPYHYVRVHPYNEQFDILISGGEDHPTGNTSRTKVIEEKRYKLVEEWTREHFPIGEIVSRWSGQVMEPMDGVAYIGHNPWDHKNIYIVTGDSGNGMTHCSFAGLLISDLINGKQNKWEKIYRPSRFTFRESLPVFWQVMRDFKSYMKQMPNFNGARELLSIQKGEGKVIGLKEETVGVYRNNEGKLFIVSAQCTHVKCTLGWNSDELSWDCACHGSRFTYEGKVINGPANIDLRTYPEPEKS